MIKAIFFDLDDTLYDQLLPFELANKAAGLLPLLDGNESIEAVFKRIRRHSDRLWPHYVGGVMTLKTLRIERTTAAFADMGITVQAEAAQRLQEQYELEQSRLELRNGVTELFGQLQLLDIRIGLITNGPVGHQMNKIKALGLLKWIEEPFVFISDGLGAAKPDPRVFDLVQQHAGAMPEQLVYVGDAWHNDIAPSFRAGWKPVWLNARQQRPEHRDGQIDYLECRSIEELVPLLINLCKTEAGCLL